MKEGEDSHPEALLSLCLMMLTDIIEFYKCLKSLSGPWLLCKIQKKKKIYVIYGSWCQTGWSEYFGICSPTGIFPQYYLQGVHTMDWKKESSCSEWLFDARGQSRTRLLLQAERKAKVTQITTCYNQVMKTTTTTSYSSWRSHHVPLLLAKTGNWHYKLHSFTKTKLQQCMAGSEFGVNAKAWISPAL